MIPMEDQRELEELHRLYVHAIDRGDLALLRSLYADDAQEQHGEFCGSVDEYVAWLEPVLGYFDIATHTMSNLLFWMDGDKAQSEGRGTAFLRMKGAPPFNMIVVNRHFDKYQKVEGQWRFASRCVCVDWAEQFAPRDGLPEITSAFPVGSSGLDDLLYREVPELVEALRRCASREARPAASRSGQ